MIGITNGLRGYFAVLYDECGPIQSGIGSYETPEGAADEARDWAVSEGGIHLLDNNTQEILYGRFKNRNSKDARP
jgi:hypothetical protein